MIQTTFWQEDSPEKVEFDSAGTTIEIGKAVAYNYQGSVIFGKIIEIIDNKWRMADWDRKRWNLIFKIKIRNEKGHVSIVKNPNSFIII